MKRQQIFNKRKNVYLGLLFVTLSIALIRIILFVSSSTLQEERGLSLLGNIRTKKPSSSWSSSRPIKTLWLITCETRLHNPQLANWWLSVQPFLRTPSSASASDSPAKVEARNVCQGKEWTKNRSFLLKFDSTVDFLNSLSSNNSSSDDAQHDHHYQHENDIVIFTDADTVFNSKYLTPEDILSRFYALESKVVIAGEPSCWIGRVCTSFDIRTLYPWISSRSSCPQFVNSGQYVGYLTNIRQMLDEILHNMTDSEVVGPSPLDDQARMTLWYSRDQQRRFSTGQQRSVLDTNASLFRSMLFGIVDSNNVVKELISKNSIGLNCGDVNDKLCGQFLKHSKFLGGYVRHITRTNEGNNTPVMEMYPVPECDNVEPNPLSIHGNGPDISDKTFTQLSTQFLSELKKNVGNLSNVVYSKSSNTIALTPSSSSTTKANDSDISFIAGSFLYYNTSIPTPFNDSRDGVRLLNISRQGGGDSTNASTNDILSCEMHSTTWTIFIYHPHFLQTFLRCWSYFQLQDPNNTKQKRLLIPEKFHKEFINKLSSNNFIQGLKMFIRLTPRYSFQKKSTWVQSASGAISSLSSSATAAQVIQFENQSFWMASPKHRLNLRQMLMEDACGITIDDDTNNTCENDDSNTPRIGILNRRDTREILNSRDISMAIQNDLGFENEVPVTYFEDGAATFCDQVKYFATNDIIISPHGAQLSGLFLMPPDDSIVLEIFPLGAVMPWYFGSLAQSTGIEYAYMYETQGNMESEINYWQGSTMHLRLARERNLDIPTPLLVRSVRDLVQRWRNKKKNACKLSNGSSYGNPRMKTSPTDDDDMHIPIRNIQPTVFMQ